MRSVLSRLRCPSLSTWVQACLIVALAWFSATSHATPTCQKLSEVCIMPGETRIISGLPITRDCWGYQAVFQCVDPSNVNYCAGLQADANCSQSNSVCTERAFNGDCLTFVNTFDCSKPQALGQGIIEIARQFTITKDQVDEAACSVLAGNPKCAKTGRVCVQGPETRVINGLPVTKDCWEWQDTYSCAAPAYLNYCQAISQTPGCSLVTDTCGATAADGSCLNRLKTYTCGAPVNDPNIVLLNTTYTIAKDQLDPLACNNLSTATNCSLAQETCVEGPETRIINGLPITKACWRYERSYSCLATAMTGNDCADLVAQGCTKTASNCVDFAADGTCNNQANTYQCVKPGGPPKTVTNCGGQLFCMGGNCFDTAYAPDADFLKATTSRESARQAGAYMDLADLKLFSGKAAFCAKILGSLGDCCKTNVSSGVSNASMGGVSGALIKIGGELFKAGSSYVYDTLMGSDFMKQGAAAMMSTPMTESLSGVIPNGTTEYATLSGSSNFSFYGASFSFSVDAGIQFVSFDPVSFALQIGFQIIAKLLACDQQEKLLSMKRGQNLCVYVGDWCKEKFLGACVERKQGWCCFNSRLTRIIATEGRKQLGRAWGPAQAPDCAGFTDAEITQLDFSTMDFQEFYAEILNRQPDPSFRGNKNTDLVNQRVQNYFQSGKQNSPLPKYTGPPQ